jgi:membrane complex biogenesis BtpA family protein
MNITLKKIFKKDQNIIIGALHFPPLLGFSDFAGYKHALKYALADLKAFESGGVDGIFIENNYGLTKEKVDSSIAIAMGYLIGEIRKHTKLPLGASVLWNDYETAFALAHTYDLQFIRIPVFVDTVEPYCGVITGNPKHVKATQKLLKADNVAIFADILVKHSKHISTHSLESAAKKAIKAGTDAVIVTGDWTGQSPTPQTVSKLRSKMGTFPILIGSGVGASNVSDLFASANGAIVSTSLKAGAIKAGERNVKGFEQRIDAKLVTQLVKTIAKTN